MDPQSLVLDVTGDKGFLTWEALRLFSEGGVWSYCHQPDTFSQMQEWTRSFSFNFKPHLMLHNNQEPTGLFTTQGGDQIKFNIIMGYNLSQYELNHLKLILPDLIKHHLSTSYLFVFSEIDTEYRFPLSYLLEKIKPDETKLITLLKEIEFSDQSGETGSKKQGPLEQTLTSLGLSNLYRSSYTLEVKRKLFPKQVQKWLESKGKTNSSLDTLLSLKYKSQAQELKNILLNQLPGEEVIWKQKFNLITQKESLSGLDRLSEN